MVDAIALIMSALMTPLGWFTSILEQSGALPVFIGLFFAGAVSRLVLRPLLGESRNREAGDD